jgi:hypothetical protein
MDLALRAALLGWEFVYVGTIKVTTVIMHRISSIGGSVVSDH